VALHLRRPSVEHLERLLLASRSTEVTYDALGCSLGDVAPPGFTPRSWDTVLVGRASFERARDALRDWAVHRGSGIALVADGPLEVGTNAAMAAPLPLGWVDVTCRVVAVIDEEDSFGFAYGTLPVHPERGEESFVVTRRGDISIFTVTAVSRLSHPLARLAPPVADRLQSAATARYLRAMRTAAS